MGKFKEIHIEAAEALSAVGRHIQTLPIAAVDGWVEELRYTGDGFLVQYAVTVDVVATADDDEDDLRQYLFAVEGDVVCAIERSEYDLAAHDAMDLSRDIPELMELAQEQDPM